MKNNRKKYWWGFVFTKTGHISSRMLAATEKEMIAFLLRWSDTVFGKENPIKAVNDGPVNEK